MHEILDIVCYVAFENTEEDNTEEWLQCDACELSFQHKNTGNVAVKQKEEEDGKNDSKEGQSTECITHGMAP
jgi:hypothetical protein